MVDIDVAGPMEMRVSVVDDDLSFRSACARVLTLLGMTVIEFASGREFLSSGEAEVSTCLILDVHMPEISGWEVCQRLATVNCKIPIILVSGDAMEGKREGGLGAGVVRFLQKPISVETLSEALEVANGRLRIENWELGSRRV